MAQGRPARRLEDEPVVESEADIGLAMREMAWIEAEQKRIKGEANRDVARIKEAAEKKLSAGGVSFAVRLKALTESVVAYAVTKRDEMLAGLKGKTKTLTHGELKFQEQREAVSIDSELAELHAEIVEGLNKLVTDRLSREKIGDNVRAMDLFDVSVTLNLSRTLEAVRKRKTVTVEQLASCGLQVSRPAEKIAVKPFDYSVIAEE